MLTPRVFLKNTQYQYGVNYVTLLCVWRNDLLAAGSWLLLVTLKQDLVIGATCRAAVTFRFANDREITQGRTVRRICAEIILS